MKKILSIILCVCLLATSVMTVPMVSAEEATTEYIYHANDYESLTNDDEWLAKAKLGTTMSVESGDNVIGGSKSLKATSDGSGNGYVGFAFSNVGVPVNVSTRVSFDYKVTVGTKGWSGVGYIGHSKATNSAGEANVDCYNWANINGKNYSNTVNIGDQAASTTVRSFKNTITRNDSGSNQLIGIFWNDKNAASEIVFDNLVIAQIINTVSAVSDNEAKGTVAVANKDESLTDYAMGETAVFTATPADGYSFAGWYNGDVLVSTDATYEHTLTGDITLTAKWKLYEKEYFYSFNDFEALTEDADWLAQAKQGTTMSVESGDNVISGNKSLKTTTTGVGYSGFALSDAKVPKNMKTRVSFNYKVTVGTKGWSGVGYIGHSKVTNSAGVENVNCYNWSNINGESYSNKVTAGISNSYAAATTVRSFKNTFTRNDAGSSQPFGIFMNDGSAALEVIFDDVKIAEIIDTVAVVNSDEAKGTVSVANKETAYTDYAVGEVAVFTATPADGYSFKGWYDREDNLVSTSATYEHTLVTDTTLTAKWKLYEKEYDYKVYDYENYFNDSFPYSGIVNTYSKGAEGAVSSIVSEETANPISGNSSYKYFWGNGDTIWAFLTPKTAENKLLAETKYRVTGKFEHNQTTSAIASMYVGASGALFRLHGTDYANAKVKAFNGIFETGRTYDFGGTITTVEAGWPTMHGYTKGDYTTDYVLFDDIVYAQIIDTVSATSENEAMGSATVVNKAGYDDYAKNEIAVFTATPVNGYYLEGWYNANGEKVSTDKVYEATLTTDTNLTAKFAAYDVLYTISFNTNGGNEIESVSNGAGADFAPETPVKDGYVFAGWYADANCTTPFTATTFPAEDITIYAKWVNGSYQDFESYEGTPSGNFEVLTDGENAYLGNGYLKYSADAKDNGSRIVVSDEALKDFAFPGDKIEVSFKYKLLSGDAKFYMHTSVNSKTPSLAPNEATTWLNVYEYKNTNLVVSEDWQTVTAIVDLKNYAKATAEGFTVDNYLYSIIFLSSTNGAELYIDEVTLSSIPGTFVKTAYNSAAALRSAEASSTGKNGLRIYNEVDTYWANNKNIVEYGSVAAYSSKIDGEITLENGNKGVAYSDGTFSAEKSALWEVNENSVVFTSYLTGITASRYSEDILIRTYAIDKDGNVYYGTTASVSVFEVANAIDNANTADGSEVSAEDSAAFYTFVTDANYNAYAAWCTENSKDLGTLYNNKYAA